jgi:hypothetical protein
MLNKHILALFTILFIAIYTGCAGLGELKTDWGSLPDKKFYLTEFQYVHIDKDKKYAYDIMCNFPAMKVLYILSKEYNIEIDMSDYYRFIKTGNSSQIKTEGFVRNEKFTWKSATITSENKIIITFEKDYFDETKMKVSLNIFAGNKKIKSISIDFSRMDYLFKQLDFYISKTDQYAAEFDNNDYASKDKVPGLILGEPGIRISTGTDKKNEIKSMVEEYVKTLDSEQKKAFKHEIIDYIYKLCE